MVVQFRDAPPTSKHSREVCLVAAGHRFEYEVYRSAQNRLGRTGLNTPPPGSDPALEARVRAAQGARVQAARSRSTRTVRARGQSGAAYSTASSGFAPHRHSPIGPLMTTTALPSRSDLAGRLTDAAQAVAGILTAAHATLATRCYLAPVLGPLSAGPGVVGELNERLEDLLDEPLPTTPVGLFALASYASALGWLTESLAELTAAVDAICTRAGIPSLEPDTEAVLVPTEDDEGFDYSFSNTDLAATPSFT
ncbi:hypothetical protein [Kitasatospora sp. NPDC059673]|uniref:hypothetical protein n=1 Tax=Kitasatospora sp. NPDC059673 TaxID=3346901 RepID=UPI00369410CE